MRHGASPRSPELIKPRRAGIGRAYFENHGVASSGYVGMDLKLGAHGKRQNEHGRVILSALHACCISYGAP